MGLVEPQIEAVIMVTLHMFKLKTPRGRLAGHSFANAKSSYEIKEN